MSAFLVKYHCVRGHSFDAPGTRESAYGEFVLRTEHGNYSLFLDAFADPVFGEASEIVEKSALIKGLSDARIGELQQDAFSVTCDPAPNGLPFHINVLPHCPLCGSGPGGYLQVHPPAAVELPAPAHTRWNRLSASEKTEVIGEFIQRYLADNPHIRRGR